jgi:phage-related minor tail protein
MTDQMKVQAAVEVSTENAESALKRVGDAAGQMAERMQREGDKAGAAVDGIGSGASKSADEFSRAEGRIAASIKRATTNLELLGKSASQKLEFKIEERGLDKAKFDPLLSKLRELELRSQEASKAASASLNSVGISAAQTAAALRGVPAQFTDIATSIAGGQAPLTVFLQQGGQLKDMFGGAGAAAKALGGYVVGLLTPLNLAVAAIGGIGYAAYSGASEMDEFKKNLVLTGNASGITTDKFNSMAAAMGNISGITRGAAAEALTAMAASGNIGSASIQKLTEAALKFEKAGGPAVAETAKQFEELGKSPVDASVKLSEKTHYLTLAVYEQIKALQDQGKTSEAAAVAQNAWADAIDKRTPQLVENLGLIEQAWANIKRSASGTWDFMKDIGRDSTAAEQMADLRKKIADADKDIASGSINSNRLKQQKEQYRQELQALVDHNNAKEAEAKKRAADEAKNQAQISATSDADALIKSQRSKREQHAAELKKLDQQRSSDLLSEEKYQQAKVALAKKYEEKPASAPKRTEAEKELARMAKLDAEESSRRIANAQRVGAEMNKETEAIWAKVEAENAAREAIGLSKSGIESRTLAIMQEQLAWRDALGLEDEQTEQLKRNIAAQRALVDAAVSREATQGSFDSAKQAAKDVEEAHKKAAEKAAAEWEKVADRIDQAFHDAFVKAIEAGSNSFDAFADSIKTSLKAAVADGLYQLTARPLVMSVVGAFSGAQAAPGAAAAPASLSNGFGAISGAQSLWAAYNGGVSGAAATFARSGFGQAAGLSAAPVELAGPTMTGEALTGTALTGAGSTFAAAAGPVLGALAATYAIAEMQKSGWGSDNNAKNYAKDFALFGGTAGVVVLDRLFGHNRNVSDDARGIRGTFDLFGFSGENYQERSQKGGAFRSDRRWTDPSAIDADMDKALDSMLKQAVAGVQTIGKALNVETEAALEGFSHTFALQLSENGDMSKAGEKIAAELKKVQDELVTKLVPNIEDFARYGESASDTFARLNQEVTATDAILLAMGKDASEAFGAVGLASIKAREDLIDLAGGLDALASKTQFYYANFYTSDEQMQRASEQAQKVLGTGFAELGLSIPATREAFRALVESQDLATEGGRNLFNSLLDLSDEFDTVADASDATADSLKKTADKLKEATTTAQQGQASLFDTFATDAQKLSAAQKLVNDAFAGLGKTVPATAGDFLKLTQAIDPASEAGQSLIATLGKVSGAFAYIQTAATAAADASIVAINNARNTAARGYFSGIDLSASQSGYMGEGQAAIDKLFGSISDGAITAAQTAADAAATAASGWKSAAQSIKSSLENIRSGSLSGLSPEARYNLLKSQFATTSAAARGGNLEAAGNLGQIASDFLSASRDYNASSEAFQQDRASADAALDESLKYAGAQVSLQQSIADASKASVTQLQTINQTLTGFAANAQELLQKSYAGADRGTATAAVGKLADVQAFVDQYFANVQTGYSSDYAGGTVTRLDGNSAQFTDANGNISYVRAGESVLDIARRVDALRNFWSQQFGVNLPSYAVGTPFVPQDQVAQIHQGEMIIPAATASQLRKYGIGSQPDSGLQSEMLAEMRATRQAQQQSYAGMQQQLAASNAKLAEVSKRLAAMEDQARLTRAGQ